jgi:hypothetical protein
MDTIDRTTTTARRHAAARGLTLLAAAGSALAAGQALGQGCTPKDAFALPEAFALFGSPTGVALADANGDGNLDALLAADGLSVLLGDGAGGFAGEVRRETTNFATSIAVGDIDGDGDVDALLAGSARVFGDPPTIELWLGDGAGGFAFAQAIALGDRFARIERVVLEDFTGDGRPDLAAALTGPDAAVAILDNLGGGAFAAPRSVAGIGRPWRLATLDIEGDGDLDLAVVDQDFGAVALRVLTNDGAGSFTLGAPVAIPGAGGASPFVEAIVSGVFFGDDDVDLAIADASGQQVVLFAGDGAGGFVVDDVFGDGKIAPRALAIAREADGDDALVSSGQGEAAVLLSRRSGLRIDQRLAVGANANAIAVGDLNGDGAGDLVLANAGTSDVSVILGDAASVNELFIEAPRTLADTGPSPATIATADFNGDGLADLLTANSESDGILDLTLFFGDGSGGFASQRSFGFAGRAGRGITGDFDGDGNADALVTNRTDGTVENFFGNGSGAFVRRTPIGALGSGPAYLAAGDLDGDGDDEAIATGVFAGSLVSIASYNAGLGRFEAAGDLDVGGGLDAQNVAVADIDGDGDLDVATTAIDYGASRGELVVFRNDGAGGFGPGQASEISTNMGFTSALTLADLDGDGLPEAIVGVIPTFSPAPSLYVLTNDGSGGFGPAEAYNRGIINLVTSIDVADVTGDGVLDVLAAGSEPVSIFQGAGDGTLLDRAVVPGGTGPTSVVAVDLDGDGAVDLAAAHATSDVVEVTLSACEATPACPADLDGDGELTIFDFLAFQNLFDAGDPIADFDGDGSLTIFDFLAFQNAFDAGCP